jgi:CRP-like cAMP-binding protein
MTSMTSQPFSELDDIDFLRRAELFRSMPEEVILAISARAKTVTHNTGEIVVKRGDPGDRVFVVKSGTVEVMSPADSKEGAEATPLAYLGPGECFGELAILTSSPRTNDVRVPEQAQLLIIPRGLFDELMQDHAGFAAQLCVILAHRLVKALQGLPINDKKELHGSLRYFDLPTVVQTLISSGQNGVMALSVGGRSVATLSFHAGNIFRAGYGHRSGDEAVHHLFQAPPDADFRFSSTEHGQAAPDAGITIPAMALMMDSVRLQDELDLLKEKLPPPDTGLTRASEAKDWTPLAEGQDDDAARSLWLRLERAATVRQLIDESPSCHYHAARALIALLEAKRIQPVQEARS